MDEENFDAESSRLQIKKLKEKVKSLVSEVDLSREIRSYDFPKTPKLQLECNIGDNSSDLETVDGDEFIDINEADFANEENWLIDANSNCNVSGQPSGDIFNALYSETDDYDADIGDILRELRLLRNPPSCAVEAKGPNNRNALIDSRTFTRPKKSVSRPPLTSIISNSGEDGRRGKLQRRPTTAVLPTQCIINKLEDLNRVSNRAAPGLYGESNWEEGSQECLADIENSSVKSQRKSLPASIIDRLQELKRSNNSYVSCRTPETGKHLNIVNGNADDSFEMNIAREARKVIAALDLNFKSVLSTSCGSDIFKNIPEYFSDNDNDSFLNLEEVSSFGDRLQLFTDSTTYSSLLREMEQNEIGDGSRGENYPEDVPLSRMTFGGVEIPLNTAGMKRDMNSSQQQLLEIDDRLNETYKVVYDESSPKGNATFEVINRENDSGKANLTARLETERKSSLVDVILQSDIIKSLNPNYSNKYCDNRNGNGSDGDGGIANNDTKNFNETYAQNELNKLHSEKYTTKIFDSSFKKSSPSDKSNGKKDSDHSEDDCMSTTSDNSYRSVDSSNAELKNIEELENIALQQNRKLADVKFSTPRLQNSKSKGSLTRNSEQWRDISPIRKDVADGESQGSSNASSRGPSPRRAFLPSAPETSRKSRPFPLRQPSKVAQRELKLKPALIRPLENFKRPVNNGRTSSESVAATKGDCKTSVSAGGIPVVKQTATPVTAVSSTASTTRVVTRIPSGIPRPSSRLKQPQIRVPQVFKK